MRPEKRLINDLVDREGISKSELARRMGKCRSTVCGTLKDDNERSMLVSDLEEYAEALGYELEVTAKWKGWR